jgi:hypothetical protein
MAVKGEEAPETAPADAGAQRSPRRSELPAQHGKTSIQSAAQTAEALKPFVGQSASAIFALGFIGSGLLASPVLAGVVFIGR